MISRTFLMPRLLSCAFFSLALIFSLFSPRAARAQQSFTETTLYDFCTNSGCSSGKAPLYGLIQASDGNLYGTAQTGGNGTNDGDIFQLNLSGVEVAYYDFCQLSSCTDGEYPEGGVIEGSDGNLYGTTNDGGLIGNGLVYKLTPAGTLTRLYSFCEQTSCADADYPQGSLVEGSDGNYYGAATSAGPSAEGGRAGVIFKITSGGSYSIFYPFCSVSGCTDGQTPSSPPLQGSDGNFYGVTSRNCESYCNNGTVYKLTTGAVLTTLYTFCQLNQCLDGNYPVGPLVEAGDGNYYGVTSQGGGNGNYGSVFQVNGSTGAVTTNFYSFCANTSGDVCLDGNSPNGGLYVGSDGNLYGTTAGGGANNEGTAFQLTTGGALTTIYSFCSTGGAGVCYDGATPTAGLVQASNGNFYGLTNQGGTQTNSINDGTVYELIPASPLLGPVQVSLSQSSIALGSSVTLTWHVSNAFSTTLQQCYAFVQGNPGGAGTWTGKQMGTVTAGVLSGSASIKPTAGGTFTYALTCGGQESNFATLTVTGKAATTTTITATPNPATVGQQVTLRATVTAGATGTVTFSTNGGVIATVPLTSGVASFTASTQSIAGGSYPVIATYSGNTGYATSSSAPLTVVLNKAGTTTTVSASPNPVTSPASVTLTATVTRTGENGTPTGTVTFYYTTINLGTAPLSGGVATLTAATTNVPSAMYDVVAKYSGDSGDSASSGSVIVTVQ